MSYPFNYPTPVNCNIQSFTGSKSLGVATTQKFTWQKPQGVSFIWFTLIGSGGDGASSNATQSGGGGGSGAVTNCLMPAFLVPDSLVIQIANSTQVQYVTKSSTYTLLQASNGAAGATATGGAGGTASAANNFSCAGFYQSIAGQAGVSDASITPSGTTFLSGGSSAATPNIVTSAYGYVNGILNVNDKKGYFLTQPIIVGLGGSCASNANSTGNGGIGCGGGGNAAGIGGAGGVGGRGAVFIISW